MKIVKIVLLPKVHILGKHCMKIYIDKSDRLVCISHNVTFEKSIF